MSSNNSTTATGTGSGTAPTTSTVTTISSLTTTTSDTSTTSDISTTTPQITTSSTPIISISSSTPPDTPTVITSTVSGQGGVITVTVTTTPRVSSSSSDGAASLTSSGAAGALATGGGGGGSDNNSVAGKVVPAVIVPVVVIALLIAGGIWFFRRRRATKEAEELRRKEVEEYGFNPNADTGFGGSAAAGMTATNDNAAAMSEVDGSGYRGWGTTSNARKASTTLGSASVGAAAIGLARSDSGENGGYGANGQPSPNGHGNASYSDHNSGDPLVHQSRPISQDFEGVAALGAAPAAGNRNGGVHRGPSNASSAYSGGQRSDTSGEIGTAIGSPTWGNEYLPEDGPYGGPGGAAPVIRDVSARRNTRIESPAVMPQQPRGGISQNF